MPKTLEPVRRIVTGHDDGGKAVVILDSADPHLLHRPELGIDSRPIWRTEQTPAEIDRSTDSVSGTVPIAPPDNGSVFRIVDFPPADGVEALDPATMQRLAGGGHADEPAPRHPMMHRTRSVDYAVIMSGEIDMLLDDSEVHCRAGDVVVQQGTNHAWVNRGTEPCRIAFVLIDGKPIARPD